MINTLIEKYCSAVKESEQTNSPRRKLVLIINFFRECEKLDYYPPDFTFIEEFIPVLISIFRNSNVNFIDPEYLLSAKQILALSKDYYDDDITLNEIKTVISLINMQLLKMYFYLGEFEEGLVILNKIISEQNSSVNTQEQKLSESLTENEQQEKNINKYAIVSPEVFKKSRAFEILDEIKFELERLNSYSQGEINTILVEEDYSPANEMNFGLVQTLYCKSEKLKKQEREIAFSNITDLSETDFTNSLNRIRNAVKLLLYNEKVFGEPYGKLTLSYTNYSNIYKGTSFLFAGSVLSFCTVFNERNSRDRYLVSSSAAFTGSIDEKGYLQALPSGPLRSKLHAMFFSWIRTAAVPKDNLNESLEEIRILNKKYPHKKLKVIGISNIAEVTNYPELIRKESDTNYEFIKKFIKRNSVTAGILFSILMLLAGIFAALKILPREFKPLPVAENEMYLIYAPDRDTNWIFVNSDYFGGDTIDFGDVAVGDQWFPLIEFINNSRDKEEFNVYVDGQDKNDFQLTWLYNNNQPDVPVLFAQDAPQILYVKFVPIKPEGKRNAVLVFENKKTGSSKWIYLTGVSKRLNKGYSIAMEEVDDALVLEPNTNLLQDKFTIAFWIKPLSINPQKDNSFFFVENNPLTNNKLSVYLRNSDTIISLFVYGSKSQEIPRKEIETNFKFRFGEWNYFAITFKDTVMSVVLNDSAKSYSINRNLLRKLNDCIHFGVHPSSRAEMLQTYKSEIPFKYYLDEFKIYNAAITADELIKNRFNSGFRGDELLAGYDFDDATPKRFYDKSINDFWPRNYGAITRVIDSTQPFGNYFKKQSSAEKGNTVLERNGKGFLKLNRNIFIPKSSFSFQCDFKMSIVPDKNIFRPMPFFVNRSGLDIRVEFHSEALGLEVINVYKNKFISRSYDFKLRSKWEKFTVCYDAVKNEYTVYMGKTRIIVLSDIDLQDITQNYMGISFAAVNYYGAPRFTTSGSMIDNIKLYDRPLNPDEIMSPSNEGLLAYWTFEKTDGELAYDEISRLPLIMWEDCRLVKEEIDYR